MVKITKCDICGKQEYLINIFNKLIFIKYEKNNILVEDICDDCLNKVKNLINRLKNNEQ